VRELDDGRVLLHAFCGCDTGSVLGNLGLTLADLFPERLPGHGSDRKTGERPRMPARELLEVISEEVTVVAMIAADILDNRTVSAADWQRLSQAAARIGVARDHIRPDLEPYRGQ